MRTLTSWAVVCAILFAPAVYATAAPPKLDHFFPAGVAAGESVPVTASGSFTAWPVDTWVDREGLVIECDEEKGKLRVTAAADAAPGVYWIRLHDGEGASTARPLVVGNLPEVVEVEPNDAPHAAQPLEGSTVVNGRLGKSGDVDGFSIALEQGQTLVASLMGNAVLGSPMDALLQVCTADGFVLEQNDDAGGLDPRIVFSAPYAGRFLVRTFAFPSQPNSSISFAGGDAFIYRLTITTGGFVDHTLPLAVSRTASTDLTFGGWNLPPDAASLSLSAPSGNGQIVRVFHESSAGFVDLPVVDAEPLVASESNGAQPQPIRLPADISGRLENAGDVGVFKFAATKGNKIRFQVIGRVLLSPLDAVLTVSDETGKVLSEVDDVAGKPDPELVFTPPADGDYVVTVRDLHGRGGLPFVYRLTAAEVEPDFALSLASDSFVLTPGTPLEVPVAIDRRDGFTETIEITARGLPEGVAFEAAVSEGKGDTAKEVKLKLTCQSGPVSGSFQISGSSEGVARASEGDSPLERTASFPTTDERWRLTDAWLTVLK